jgi:hypothetical protein
LNLQHLPKDTPQKLRQDTCKKHMIHIFQTTTEGTHPRRGAMPSLEGLRSLLICQAKTLIFMGILAFQKIEVRGAECAKHILA